MKPSRQIDPTTGHLSQHFRTLAIPAAIGMVFNTLYNMVDMYFAGRLATESQAGISIGFGIFFIYIAFGFGLSAAISALVGRALGAKNKRAARRLIGQGLIFALQLSAFLMAIGLLLSPALVEIVSDPGPYRDAANRYLFLLLLAICKTRSNTGPQKRLRLAVVAD